jgi:hypothetical protein
VPRKLLAHGRLILVLFGALIAFSQKASAADIELSSINGDGVSLTTAFAPDGSPALVHINAITGELRYRQNQGQTWSDELIASGYGAESSVAIAVVNNEIHVVALNSNNNTVIHYQRSGTWFASPTISFSAGGRIGLAVRGSDLLVSFMNRVTDDLVLARRVGSTWGVQTIDSTPEKTGSESAIAIAPDNTIAIAYFDATNMTAKVATSQHGTSWNLESLSFPGGYFGKAPSVRFAPDGALFVLSGDVIQNPTVGGKGLVLAQKMPSQSWEYERIGFPAAAGLNGTLLQVGSTVKAAMVSQLGDRSEVVIATRAANGLWGGAALARSYEGIYSNLTISINSVGEMEWFSRYSAGSTNSILGLGDGGETLPPEITPPPPPPPPSPTPTPIPTPQPTPQPTPIPTPQPTPEPRGFEDDNLLCFPWVKKKNSSALLELTNRQNFTLEAVVTLRNSRGRTLRTTTLERIKFWCVEFS